MERTLAGDTEAFAVLHRRYYSRIYRLAFFRTRSSADAEDIASETFVKAISYLPTYRFQSESLFPWLARIASNLVSDLGRRQKGVTAISLDGTTDNDLRALIEGIPSNAPDPQMLAERMEVQALVRDAIARLPRDQEEAILLRYLGELSLRDIATTMGRSEGAIKSLLHRGLVNLRRTLATGLSEAEQFATRRTQANAQQIAADEARSRQAEMVERLSNLEIDDD
ncbi:MAG: hypothetical protein OHK0029_27340 [Armatimonadaceae bacterium]